MTPAEEIIGFLQRLCNMYEDDHLALMKVVKAAEGVAPLLTPYHKWNPDQWKKIVEFKETLETLPEHLK